MGTESIPLTVVDPDASYYIRATALFAMYNLIRPPH